MLFGKGIGTEVPPTGGAWGIIDGRSKPLRNTMELNPIRQRIADLKGRLDSLRGYL